MVDLCPRLFLALNGNKCSDGSAVSNQEITVRESLQVKWLSECSEAFPFSTKLHVTRFSSHRQHLLSGLSKSTFLAAKIIFL